MIKRLIPLTLALFATLSAFAQVPKAANIEGEIDPSNTSLTTVTCPAGVSAFAGTSSQTLFPNAQSNDIEFLCLGDSMAITHLGGQTFGDPDPTSAPGISYVFYTCPPTQSGIDFDDILSDPCHLVPLTPPDNLLTVQNLIDINGNATFFNTGFLQTNYNSDSPMELWFAPITVDDFALFSWETDGVDPTSGPCTHVNTNDAFSVVYLNEITGTNINPTANGSCGGSFTVSGGLAEFDGSDYTNISITLSTDPSVTGSIANNAPATHGEVVNFNVPEPGIYNVVIEDGKSCGANFTIDMSACNQLQTGASQVTTLPGQPICVPVLASNFNNILSFQYTITYDPTVLTYQTINQVDVPNDLLFASPSPGNITISWNDTNSSGVILPDGTVLYEICFLAIGAVGQSSPIDFNGNLTPIEVTEADGFDAYVIGYEFLSGSVTISNNSITLDLASCSTTSDEGTISVTASGGTAPFNVAYSEVGNPGNNGMNTIATNGGSYTFDNGVPDVYNITPGTYNIIVTDANGDIQTGTVTVVNTDPLLVQIINVVNPTCPDGADASLTANINGGVSPIMTEWSNGETTNIINNLPDNSTHTVTVTDNNGCVATAQQSVFVDDIMITIDELNHVSCTMGPADGFIEVTATGGNGGFSYLWSNGDSDNIAEGLTAGNYTVTATDVNMCSAILTITVNAPIEPVILGFDSIGVSCANDLTGELTPNPIMIGNSPIDAYQWGPNANNQITETATGLSAGTYSLTITDMTGCTDEASYTLWAPAPMMVDTVITKPTCTNVNDGKIQLVVTGGSGDYQILWAGGAGGSDFVISNLPCDSTYSVFIADNNGCDTVNLDIYLDCPSAISITLDNITEVTCNDDITCNGSALAIGSAGPAGTGLYNYTWSSGEVYSLVQNSTAMSLCQGPQFVIVDDGMCFDTAFFTIEAPELLEFILVDSLSPQVSCFGGDDGELTVDATGGNPPYDFTWTNPVATGPTVTNLTAGSNYVVIVEDANGCIEFTTLQVNQPMPLVASIDSTNSFSTSCFGLEDGQITAAHEGGNAGLHTYDWDPDVSNTITAINVGIGTYTVTVTDPKGCTDVASYTVIQPEPIFVIVADTPEPMCNGEQTVVTLDSVSGGIGPPYKFSVDFGPPQFEESAIPVLAGTHTVTVFDDDGCSTEVEISVGQPAPLLVDLGPDTTIQLGDSLQLDPAIGSVLPVDTLYWNPLDYLTCTQPDSLLCYEPWVAPLETQMYELTVIDTNGCFGTDQIIVDIDKNRNVFIPNAFSPNGDGPNDLFKMYTGVGVRNVNYLRIFDRWGEQLYQQDNFLPGDFSIEGWDGRFKGKLMDTGVYIYIAEVEFVDGIVLLYRGDITLLR